MSSTPATGNRLINQLPARQRREFLSHCTRVTLARRECIASPGQTIDFIDFPTGSVISLHGPGNGQAGVGVGLVGREGVCDTWQRGTERAATGMRKGEGVTSL